jgi:hypothetical protein
MIFMRKFVTIAVITLAVVWANETPSYASPEREFIMSCTYGVLAGTLVGAATLAFTKQPGQNLQNVARGASLGLYAGIALGFYTVYVLPKQLDKEQENLLDGQTEEKHSYVPHIMFFPIADEKPGVGGVAIWRF